MHLDKCKYMYKGFYIEIAATLTSHIYFKLTFFQLPLFSGGLFLLLVSIF